MLAALVVERWASGVGEAPPEVDLVTWVPADRTRARHRGVHVPEQVARRLAHHLGVPAVPLLQRPGPSVAQRGLGREARRVNVQGAFRIAGGFRPAVASHGKRVLLVDDVRTTGATLDAASDVLGPWCASVQGFAVAGVQNYARSAENVLTKTRPDADDLGHEPRKAAGPLTTPRPP